MGAGGIAPGVEETAALGRDRAVTPPVGGKLWPVVPAWRGSPALQWHRRILVLLIVLGLLAGLPDLRARVAAERSDHHVELVADQTTFVQLAAASSLAPLDLLDRLKAVGVQGLGVPADTLNSLQAQGLLTVFSGAAWLDARRAAGLPAVAGLAVAPRGTYALVPAAARDLQGFIVQGLETALGGSQTVTQGLVGDLVAIGVAPPPSTAGDLPLGFRPQSFDLARAAHMDVVPRPAGTVVGYDAAALKTLFAQIASAGVPVHTVLFAGAADQPVPGYPDQLATVANILTAAGWNLGVLETATQLSNVNQPGTRQINDAMGQRTVRVYTVPPWLLKQYNHSETVISLASSVQERNLRILYLHPLEDGPALADRTVSLYGDVATRLQAEGMQLGPPQPFPALRVHTWQRVLQSLAVVAGGLWLLELLFPRLRRRGYQPLAVLGVLALLLAVGSRHLSVELVGLAAASIGGGLSMYYLADRWNRLRWPNRLPAFATLWVRAVTTLLVVAGITFLGALIVATLLGDTAHLLDWEYFRGVKVTYLMIPTLALLAFGAAVGFGAPGRRELWPQARWLGDQPLRYKHVAAFLVILLVGAVYLLRSGNVSAAYVPGIEMHLRDFLSRVLVFRPREKEFLIGYPALFLAILCAARRQRWAYLFFVVGASVSQVSLVDSFEHTRTPFLHTVLREAFGIGLGLGIGTVVLAVAWALCRLWDREWVSGGPSGQDDPNALTPTPPA